ncbi:MAG: hypothetical protein IK065_00225 [Neisseriaceae bacterium]|nr:hypothetical protein [Neisseriaceae bacterium]
MKDDVQEIDKIQIKIETIMSIQWFISSLLLLSFVDMYVGIKYKIGFLQFVDNFREYYKISDIIIMIILFSLIFSCIFPVIRYCYFAFYFNGIFEKIGFNMFVDIDERDKNKYIRISKLKFLAINDNNSLLLNYCTKKEMINNKQKYITKSLWGIVLFTIISSFALSENSSFAIILELTFRLCSYFNNSKLFIIIVFVVVIGVIAYLFSSLKLDITEYYIDNPKEAIKTYNRNQKEENK